MDWVGARRCSTDSNFLFFVIWGRDGRGRNSVWDRFGDCGPMCDNVPLFRDNQRYALLSLPWPASQPFSLV